MSIHIIHLAGYPPSPSKEVSHRSISPATTPPTTCVVRRISRTSLSSPPQLRAPGSPKPPPTAPPEPRPANNWPPRRPYQAVAAVYLPNGARTCRHKVGSRPGHLTGRLPGHRAGRFVTEKVSEPSSTAPGDSASVRYGSDMAARTRSRSAARQAPCPRATSVARLSLTMTRSNPLSRRGSAP